MTKRITVEVLGDIDHFERQMKAATRQVDTFGSKISHAGKMAGVAAGAAGIGALAIALKAGISEWNESTKVAAQTAAVLKSTGGAANVTARQVDALSKAMLLKTGIDDEAIKSGENILLTFRDIRNEAGKGNDVFNQATRATLDLSTAMHLGLEQAALQVGKALNDPARGMSRLQRIGVAFTEAQKDQVKALMASGQTLAAQKIILGELNKEFGKSAEAAGNTLPGKLKILREQFNNLAGDLITQLAPSLQRGTEKLSAWLGKSENQKRITDDVTKASKALKAVIDAITGAVRTLLPILQKIVEALGGMKTVLFGLIGLKVALMFTGWGSAAAIAAGEVTALGLAFSALGPAIAVATAAYLGYQALQQGQTSAAGDLMPVFRNGKWVDPNTGKAVPDQARWNKGKGVVQTNRYPLSQGGKIIGRPNQGTHSRSERGYIWQDDDAVDIEMKAGTKVLAVADGVIDDNLRYGGDSGRFSGWGFTLIADSGDQFYYKHVKFVNIKAGQRVKRGQYIGLGTTTGHLHFAKKGARTTNDVLFAVSPVGGRGGGGSGKSTGGGAGSGGGAGAGAITQSVAAGVSLINKTLSAAAKLPGGTKTARGTYSYTQLRSLWAANGGDPVVADIAAAIAVAESGGRSWAINKNSGGSIDFGCWQINSVHGYDSAKLLDGDQSFNAQCAVAIYSSQGFRAWTMYRNGTYLKYMHGNHSPTASGVASASVEGDQAIADSTKSRAQKAKDRVQKAKNAAIAALTAETTLAAKLAKQRGVDPTTVYGPWAHPHARGGGHGVKAITGDALVPPALAARLQGLMDRFKGLATAAGLLTGKAAEGAQAELLANIEEQRSVLQDEAAALKVRLKRSTGKQRAAVADEITRINGRLSDVNDQILGALQGAVQTQQGRLGSVFDKVRARMTAQFEAQTQGMLDRLGVKFFQGGALTPAEQALKAWTDARSQKNLHQAVSDAQAQWAKAVTPEEKQAAQDAIQAAEDAVEQDRLEAAASRERAAADKAYAQATAQLQAERSKLEQAMNDRLDALIESILNGTGSIADLGAIAGEFGVTADLTDLSDAAGSLADAFQALADFIDVIMGKAPGSHPGGSGNPTAPGGDSWWTKGAWWAPGLDTTSPGSPAAWMVKPRPGGTLVRLAERGRAEVVGAAGGSRGGNTYHFTLQTTVPPSDVRRWIKDNAPALRDELRQIGG